MMKRTWVFFCVAMAIAVAVGVGILGRLKGVETTAPTVPRQASKTPPDRENPSDKIALPVAELSPANGVPENVTVVTAVTTNKASVASGAPPKKKRELKDPIARDALSMVGADPDAEEYWLAAINDLSLPANERQDLIEDLNEVGFADPKNLTVADVPLIVNRILIIEELGPDALDKVNADAFAEAYKDLVNMYAKLAEH